jgi:Protein of unknown function (DUF3137)
MDNPVLYIIAAVLVLVVTGAIYGAIQAQKRRDGLAELALRLNLKFNPDTDYDLASRFGFLQKLAQGDNRYCYNVLSGAYQGDDVLAFDYHYQVTTHDKDGSHTTHYRFSFFILQMPATFPDLTIRRQSFLLKIAEAFGYQDIKFESAEFSKTFCVRSPDKKFAYDVCNAKMMEYLLANRDLSLEIENQALALAFDSCLAVEEVEPNLNRLVAIRSLLPGYLFTNA